MFAYCNNNPCNKIDYCGSKPGDLFDTMDEAAKDFAEYINAKSIEKNKEYYSYIYTVVEYKTVYVTYVNPNFLGSNIFSGFFNFLFKGQIMKTVKKTVKVVRYTYIEPVQGSKDNVIGPAMAHFLCSKVALLHTHAAYDPRYDNDSFSNTDKQFSNISRVPFYVATPLGTLRRYNPRDRSDALLYSDIPYDPNHPQR